MHELFVVGMLNEDLFKYNVGTGRVKLPYIMLIYYGLSMRVAI